MTAPLPAAARPLVAFPALLRSHGFRVAPEQTTSFLAAVELLGPRHIEDVRRGAVATLAPHPEQRALFDALFDQHFLGSLAEPGDEDLSADEEMPVQEDTGSREVLIGEEINETGQAATGAEALALTLAEQPDLVLSDWNMPEMNGIDLLRALRTAGSRVPRGLVTSGG